MITLPHEIRLFWKGKRSGSSILFFVNRYLTLFVYIFNLATMGSMSDSVSFGVNNDSFIWR